MESLHIVISGLVQGVGFRYFVYRHASAMQLRGYVKNLYTGEVEVYAEGGRELLEQFLLHLRAGPRSAHVHDIKVKWGNATGKYYGFEVE